MSKFQSTVSTVAALCSIFGVAAAGWKVADSQREYEAQKTTIETLEQRLRESENPEATVAPEAAPLPAADPPATVSAPPAATLPPPVTPPTPPPPPVDSSSVTP